MRLNTCLYSVTSLRMHTVMSYPPYVLVACRGATSPSPTSTLLHSYHQEITTHTHKHDDTHEAHPQLSCQLMMVTLWAVLIWHQWSNQQNRKCNIIRLICRWKPEFQYSWNGIICSIILWYMYIHQYNLPQKCMSHIHDMTYSSSF